MEPGKEADCSLGQGFRGVYTVVLKAYIGSSEFSRLVQASKDFYGSPKGFSKFAQFYTGFTDVEGC